MAPENSLPKHILDKIGRLNKKLDEAYALKIQVEKWAEKQGADTCSMDWHRDAVDDTNSVSGLFAEGVAEHIGNLRP